VPSGGAGCANAGGLLIKADYNRLSRVFDNLIGNAVKFSPDGGTITVRAEPERDSRRVLVSIGDQGIGIAPDQVPYIFERFFRGDRKRFGGSGLGLYIVQQIIEAHRGQVWVTSEQGVGSTFTFALSLLEG
jgi:signal transduction histidine kinase